MTDSKKNGVLLNPHLPKGGAFQRQGRHWGSTPRNGISALFKEPCGNRQKASVLLPSDAHTSSPLLLHEDETRRLPLDTEGRHRDLGLSASRAVEDNFFIVINDTACGIL